MREIFISYRIEDSKPWAVLIAQGLSDAFGADHVFLDKDTLHAGEWRDQIGKAVRECRVFLLIIGRRWLTLCNAAGAARLDDPLDVHRWEIATALSAPGTTVVPLTVDGATLPQATQLPAELARLVDRQALDFSDRQDRRSVDMAALIKDVQRLTGLACRPTVPARSRALRLALMAVSTLLSSAAIWTALLVHDGVPPSPQEAALIAIVAWLLVLAVHSVWRRLPGVDHARSTR